MDFPKPTDKKDAALENTQSTPLRRPLAAGIDWAIFAVALFVVVCLPKSVSGDGRLRYEMLERFVETGRLLSPKYSTLGPLFSLPLYLLGRAFGAAKAVTSYYNAVLFLIALGLIWREFRDELSVALRRLLLLLLVCASMYAHHVQRYHSEVFTSVLVSAGVFWLSRGHGVRGWTAIVLGAVNNPASLLGVGAIAVCHARRTRRVWPLLGPVVAFAGIRLESILVRGDLLNTGYNYDAGFHNALPYSGLPNFSYPFFFGILSLLLSFGKGLVFFTPGMFFPLPASIPPRVRWIHRTLIAFVVGLLLVYAKWWSWYGGWFWGPRFFLIASIPASFALASNLLAFRQFSVARRVLVALALVLSFWLGVNGLVFQGQGLELCAENFYALEAYCHFVPEMSVLWHPFVDGAETIPRLWRTLGFIAVGFWTLAVGWVGRELFLDLLRRGTHYVLHWRDWW
ncbi:MAG TPA: hypothetical protein VIV60_36985 [Polyangiaceae bacterium]